EKEGVRGGEADLLVGALVAGQKQGGAEMQRIIVGQALVVDRGEQAVGGRLQLSAHKSANRRSPSRVGAVHHGSVDIRRDVVDLPPRVRRDNATRGVVFRAVERDRAGAERIIRI